MYRSKFLQNVREHERFRAILQEQRADSYLEIGAMYGGSLWKTATALRHGAMIVAVDHAVDTPAARPHLEACIEELIAGGYDARLIDGDSADPKVVEAAWRLAPFDCVFIDGAHTLEAVTADWENYGPMARFVAFHDISWNDTWRSSVPGRAFKAMGVPTLWSQLKDRYRHEEIQYQDPCNYYGIGVLFRE